MQIFFEYLFILAILVAVNILADKQLTDHCNKFGTHTTLFTNKSISCTVDIRK